MSSNVKANSVTRGASMMAEEVHRLSISQAIGDVVEIARSRGFKVSIVLVAFIAVLVSPKAWMLTAIDHEIDQIRIHGKLENLEVADVNNKLSGILGSSFLMADLDQIKADVESLAWVKQATVSRVWPAKVVLNVDEQFPVAYWNQGSYLNAEGDVFSPENIDYQLALPSLVGPSQSELPVREEMLREIVSLQNLLSPHLLDVQELQVDERGGWEMVLSSGITVALGNPPFEDKIDRLAALIKQSPEVALGRMERVDTRYPNGVAVKWKDVTLASGN